MFKNYENSIGKYSMKGLKNLLTFLIPIRIDSKERLRNLYTVVSWLERTSCVINILEADTDQKVSQEIYENPNVRYTFIKDKNPCFYRTKYINTLLAMSQTELSAIWDADIIVPLENIKDAVKQNIERSETITYPYNRKCIWLTDKESSSFCRMLDFSILEKTDSQSLLGRPFCGGAFLVNTRRYLSAGGENEKFTGWGAEDSERLHRCRILGHHVDWIESGVAYHLSHPRNENSKYFSQEVADKMREEFIRVCCMRTK